MHGTEEGVWNGKPVGTTIVDKEDRCEIERSIIRASTMWEAGRVKAVEGPEERGTDICYRSHQPADNGKISYINY